MRGSYTARRGGLGGTTRFAPSAAASARLLSNINARGSSKSDSSASLSEGGDILAHQSPAKKRNRDPHEESEAGSAASSHGGKRQRITRLESNSSWNSPRTEKLQRRSVPTGSSSRPSWVSGGDVFDLPQSPKHRRATVQETQFTSVNDTAEIMARHHGLFGLSNGANGRNDKSVSDTDGANEKSEDDSDILNIPERKNAQQRRDEEEWKGTDDDDEDEETNEDSLVPTTSSAFISQESGVRGDNAQISGSKRRHSERNGGDEECDRIEGSQDDQNDKGNYGQISPENARTSLLLDTQTTAAPRRSARPVQIEPGPEKYRRSRRRQMQQDAGKDEGENDADESSIDDTEKEEQDVSMNHYQSPIVSIPKLSPASKGLYDATQASAASESPASMGDLQSRHDSKTRQSLGPSGTRRSRETSSIRKTPISESSFRSVETSTPKQLPRSRLTNGSSVAPNSRGTPEPTQKKVQASDRLASSPVVELDLFVQDHGTAQNTESCDVSEDEPGQGAKHNYREDDEDLKDDGDSSLLEDGEFLAASCAFEQKENWTDLFHEARKLVKEPRLDLGFILIRRSFERLISHLKSEYHHLIYLRRFDGDDSVPATAIKEQNDTIDEISNLVNPVLSFMELKSEDDFLEPEQWNSRKKDILCTFDVLRGYVIPQLTGLLKHCLVAHYLDGEIWLNGMKQITPLLELLANVCNLTNPERYRPRIRFDDQLRVIRILARSLTCIFKFQLARMEERMRRKERSVTSPRELSELNTRQTPKRPRERDVFSDEHREESVFSTRRQRSVSNARRALKRPRKREPGIAGDGSREESAISLHTGVSKHRDREVRQTASPRQTRETSVEPSIRARKRKITSPRSPKDMPRGRSRNIAANNANRPAPRQHQTINARRDQALNRASHTREPSNNRSLNSIEDVWTPAQGLKLLEALSEFQGPDRYARIVEEYEAEIGKRTVDAIRRKARSIHDSLVKKREREGKDLNLEELAWLLPV